MRGEAAADLELGQHGDSVNFVPFLVRVAENKIEGPGEGPDEVVRVPQPGVDEVGQAGLLEVGEGLAVPPLVDFKGDEPASGLAQGPGDPEPGMAGGGPDLERPFVAVLDDEVVEDAR